MLICFACIPWWLLSFCSETNKGGCRIKKALQLEFYNPPSSVNDHDESAESAVPYFVMDAK